MASGAPASARPAWRWIAGGLGALAVALFLCSSFFQFGGAKVDESEIVLNALTIATGDWQPEWSPGYGHLAMYLPAAVLALVALALQAMGVVGSYAGGLQWLFDGETAYRVVRLVYAYADVLTAMAWAGIAWRVAGMRLLGIACFGYFLVSPDSWLYANYVRSDTLVSLFVALAVLLLVRERGRWTPLLLGTALGAAIACKYSAAAYLALIGFLLLPDENNRFDLGARIRMAALALLVAAVATFAFQPKFDYSGIVKAVGVHLSGSHFAHAPLPMTERLARLWRLVLALEPLAPACVLLAALGLFRPRVALPVLAAALIGIAPFALSQFPRDYWLIPFADALRGAAWVGCAALVWRLGGRATIAGRVAAAVIVLGVLAVATWRAPQLARSHRAPAQLSNAEAARRWLYVHAANRKELLYGYEKNFLLPRAYSFADYDAAADFSRVFIFYREGFAPLHRMFRRDLYAGAFEEFSSITRVEPFKLALRGGDGQQPRLCSGQRCYPAKKIPCAQVAPMPAGPCVGFAWDMDRAVLRTDLSRLSLELPTGAREAAVCWYSCGWPGERQPVNLRPGRTPLLELSAALFAPARVLSLTQIRKDRQRPQDSLIVTTPKAYQGWLPKGLGQGKGASGEFARLVNARLVRYFDSGSGPVIEIYARKVGAPAPRPAAPAKADPGAAPGR